jgi:hypothetical protein
MYACSHVLSSELLEIFLRKFAVDVQTVRGRANFVLISVGQAKFAL